MKYVLFITLIILIILIYHGYKKYHKSIYYFVLANILTPLFRYQASYYIDNFENIIRPFYKGEITVDNKSINISRQSQNEYALIDKNTTKDLLEDLKVTQTSKCTINKLLSRIVKHLHCDGEQVNYKDLQVIDLLNVPGNYFPFFHTDVEWNSFCTYNGFQIWILLEEDDNIKPRGNMFIMESDKVSPGNSVKISEDDVKIERNGSGLLFPEILDEYKSLDDMNPKIKYLNAKIGEVFIMNPCVFHCSDPLIANSSRRAINLRVIHNKTSHTKICNISNNYTTLLKSKHNFICTDDYCRINDSVQNMKYKFK